MYTLRWLALSSHYYNIVSSINILHSDTLDLDITIRQLSEISRVGLYRHIEKEVIFLLLVL